MKHIAYRFLFILTATALANPVSAQEADLMAALGLDSVGAGPEKVNLAFRQVDKEDVLGGVSTYSVSDWMDKEYSTYSLDAAQSMVGGYNGNIWGQGALVLIDGVPRDASSDIRANEVESVTFLKSANAVALYGSRGARGVILITTKRGQADKKVFNVQANTGVYVPKRYPQYLSSWEYMTLYNEALANDGLDALYSEQTIQRSYQDKNGYRYPSIDFYSDDYLRKYYNSSDATAEISGGSDAARFYTNLGFTYQNSLLNFGEGKNEHYLRFNARGNIDFKLSEDITALVDASAIYSNNRYANGDYWAEAATVRPNRFSPLIPVSLASSSLSSSSTLSSANLIDGKYLLGGTQEDQTNPFADVYSSGYNVYTARQFQLTVGLNYDLGRWVEGLSFQTRFAIDYSSGYTESYSNTYAVYEPTWYTYDGEYVLDSVTKYNEDSSDGTQNVSGSWYQQTLQFSAQFNYERVFAGKHNFNAILLAEGYQLKENGVYHNTCNANLGLVLSYNYRHKYYADFSGAAVHSAKMAPGKRNAFSPTIALGWRLSQEDWLKDSQIVDELKLTASAGILATDLDFDSYYMYQGYYTQSDGAWYSWKDGAASMQSTDARRGDNPDLGFAKRKEVTVGLEGRFFKGLIDLNMNFYYNRTSDIPVIMSSQYPSWFSTSWPTTSLLPYTNYNEDRRSGIDFAINFNKQFGEVGVQLGLTGTTLSTSAVKRDENYEYDYQTRVGRPLDGLWGLQSDGLFQSQDEIDNWAVSTYGDVQPGDIKYIDQNGDGIIDENDQVYLGRAGWNGAPFTFGINLTLKWKGFTLFARGTGSVGAYGMKDSSYYWVYGDGKYSEEVLNRWTVETASTATYPRLTTLSGSHNFQTSDFWRYKADRFDLAKVQLTYDFPSKMWEGKWISALKVFISGESLLTISGERKLMETNIGSSPQCRFFNLGAKVQF